MTELAPPQISSLLEALPGIRDVLRSPVATAMVGLSRAAAGLEPFQLAHAEELLRFGVRRTLLEEREVETVLAELREVKGAVIEKPAPAGKAPKAEKPVAAPKVEKPEPAPKAEKPKPAPKAEKPQPAAKVAAKAAPKAAAKPAPKAAAKPAAKVAAKPAPKAAAKPAKPAAKAPAKSAKPAPKAAKPAPKAKPKAAAKKKR